MSFQWQDKTRGMMAKLSERENISRRKRERFGRYDILPTPQGRRGNYSFVGRAEIMIELVLGAFGMCSLGQGQT